jgi:hypothetical protein
MSLLKLGQVEHYVTLFNSLFLPQGLALYRSMERHFGSFVLWVVCADIETYDILKRLDLPHLRVLKLSELETDVLKKVKPERSVREYFWTLTPYAPRFVFEADDTVSRVTYIDADLWFRKSPNALFEELNSSGKAVLITDHGYSPEFDLSATSGQFCVQFMVFDRERGEPVRRWWEERCTEWCFAREENGYFGDQKYLDDWPERFGKLVHVLSDHSLTLAPWNATRFPYGNSVFYHFQGVRIISNQIIEVGSYPLPQTLVKYVYRPYFSDLRSAIESLSVVGYQLKPQSRKVSLIRRAYHQVKRIFSAPRPYSQMRW